MNTYAKYCPNVFVAKCTEPHEKGETITLTTRHGKEHDCIVHNLVRHIGDLYYYSITRADGFNTQERAKAKADKLHGYASNAEKRSDGYYEKSREDHEFLRMAEPIKIGHHSEKRHRAIIDKAIRNADKMLAESKKVPEYQRRAEYWESKANEVNLSMPESLEYYAMQYEIKKQYHAKMKAGGIPKSHSYSLTYAKKAVNEALKRYQLAVRLWGEGG